MIGDSLNHYEILGELGRGGMGVVYEAQDSKLHRRVAIKVLPEEMISDPERRRRFLREARTVASLNHPNIVTIYAVEEVHDRPFIAMELLRGKGLSELIPATGFGLDEWLRLALPLTDAVAAAHREGVTHRDLKPANIMVLPDGRLKVLDFGLAKLTDGLRINDLSHLTTMTLEGSVVGTVAYMSPEQAEGHSIDARSDVFSLGVLLYEMATGNLPFQGSSNLSTLTAILRDSPPPLRDCNPALAAAFPGLLERCLEKDSARRFANASELGQALRKGRSRRDRGTRQGSRRSVPAAGGSPTAPSPSPRSDRASTTAVSQAAMHIRRRPVLAFIGLSLMAGMGVLLFLTLGWGRVVPAPTEPVIYSFAIEGGLAESPSWSPDGDWIVYCSDRLGSMDLWRRPAVGGTAERITTSPFNETQPAVSPDGRAIAYVSDAEGGGIFVMPPEAGGQPTRVSSIGSNPRWAPDSQELLFTWYGKIYRTGVRDAEPQLLFTSGSTPVAVWSHDGERIVFWHALRQNIFLGTASGEILESLDLVPTGEEVASLSLSRDGRRLVYSKGPFGGSKNLWSVAMDPLTLRPTEEPRRLTIGPSYDTGAELSADGRRIVYTYSNVDRQLWQFELDPETGLASSAGTPLPLDGRYNLYPAVSPGGHTLAWTSQSGGQGVLHYRDGDQTEARVTPRRDAEAREVFASFGPDGQLAYASTARGRYEIWTQSSPGSVPFPLTTSQAPNVDIGPVWSPDGQRLAFFSTRSGSWDIWMLELSTRDEPRRLTMWDDSNERFPTWSEDGRRIAYRTDSGESPDIWLLDVETLQTTPFETHPAEEAWSSWSPTGDWFYFTSDRNGVFNVWVKPGEGGESKQVTSFVAASPSGLPRSHTYTRFAVTSNALYVPIETRSAEIYIYEEHSVETGTQ